jgi:hypothetical protein
VCKASVVAAYLVAVGLGDVGSVKGDVEATNCEIYIRFNELLGWLSPLDDDEDWMLRVRQAVVGTKTRGGIVLSRWNARKTCNDICALLVVCRLGRLPQDFETPIPGNVLTSFNRNI